MTALFWVALALILYVYAGYPLLLRVLAAVAGRRAITRRDAAPPVTLVVSAYNEEAIIGTKLRNSLSLDYPPERLEIVVVSDCSTDLTDEIVRGFAGQGVVLRRMPERVGKTRGLNEAVAQARGEILVFSDGNALYRPDAIRKLVRNFHDPEVGCVTGESRYLDAERSAVGRQERTYWDYERRLKLDETRLGSMVGGDGAIMAVRRDLYEPLAAADINDFVTPLLVVKRGFRCVYEPDAVCDERGTERYAEEFRRKVRVVNRSAFAVRRLAGLLNPLRYGWFAFELLSHKVLRWAVPIWLVALFAASVALAGRGDIYRLALYGQVLFYVVALLGAAVPALHGPTRHRMSAPYYFCMVNLAALRGVAAALTGRVQITWTPERGQGRTG